jgi:hypothetical protein
VQVAFLTLFLGLISGSQRVALTAGDQVAAIELRLDGAAVARLSFPKFAGTIDFGKELVPHHLVAVGLGSEGQEVAQAEQWINLPRPPAEVEIAVEKTPGERPGAVRLTWQSLTGDRPTATSLTLDGKALNLDRQGRSALPVLDGSTHVLSAELRFGNGVTARKDVAISRLFGSETSTELTAVPVHLRGRGELPPAAQLQEWFTLDGKALAVDAVEASPAQLLVVRDPAATGVLNQLHFFSGERRAHALAMKAGSRVRFIWPTARRYSGTGIPAELFDRSQEFDGRDHGLPWLLARVVHGEGNGDARLADAVAVAGLQAAAGQRPRAVLLILPWGPGKDASRYDGPKIRRYLAAIRVPLFVWSTGPVGATTRAAWGAVEDVSNPAGLDDAFRRLEDELEAQRIVWVEGRHLPQSIALSPAARAVDLVPAP